MADTLPENYLRFNEQSVKNISVVVEIPGIDLLSNRPIFTRIRYGDARLRYGQNGKIYGGLRRLEGVRDILSLEGSSMTLSQRLEPEQGKAAISMLSLAFIDKDQYMTQVISPGILINEILGAPVKVYLGYEEISFKEDYFIIFRGRISSVSAQAGKIVLELSDPNLKRKQEAFLAGKSKLGLDLDAVATTIPVLDNFDFHQHVLGPNGLYDVPNPWDPDGSYNPIAVKQNGVRTFLKIDEEYIEYGPLGYGDNTFTGCLRGARDSIATTHETGADVEGSVQIQDHAIDMALKMMLSGWGGPWASGIAIKAFMRTFDGDLLDQNRAIILPEGVDAVEDYGLVEGDYLPAIIDATNPANNVTNARIIRFADLFAEPNRMIYIDQDLVPEFPTSATMSFRSQYDTYPVSCSVKLSPDDVDVARHLLIKGDFLGDDANRLRFFLTSSESMKSFVESQLYLPISAYSLTRRGKLSIGYTRPPLADENLVFLDEDNVIDPANIRPTRGLNNRKFYTEVDWDYDYSDEGKATSLLRVIDIEALAIMGISSILPIRSKGARTDLGSNTLFNRRSSFLLARYKRAAVLLDIKANWMTSCRIEAGDTVALKDEGKLQISNFSTGERNMGTQLFEVVDRSLDIKTGQGTMKLVSGIATDVTDRYATISPSSILDAGSTTGYLVIQDSFGPKFVGDESRKWRDYMGQLVILHNEDYSTVIEDIRLTRIDLANPYKIHVTGLLSAPAAGLIMDIPAYPASASKLENSLYKSIHVFYSARVPITAGASQTQFDVGAGDIAKFFVGAKLEVHTEDYTVLSPEVKVLSIFGNTINTDVALGFIPDSTYFVSGIGFPDKGGFYRYI